LRTYTTQENEINAINVDKYTPQESGERTKVLGMSGENLCENDMFVDILWKDKTLAMPLALVLPVKADVDTDEAVRDWHYWKDHGYLF
jgi:hypothetical protein